MSRDMSGGIGQHIKLLMAAKGLTQQQLADAVGKRRTQVNAWITGRQTPTPANLVLVAKALEVNPKELGHPYRPEDPRPHRPRAVSGGLESHGDTRGTGAGSYERKVETQMAEYLNTKLMTKLVAIVGALPSDDQEEIYDYAFKREARYRAERIKNRLA